MNHLLPDEQAAKSFVENTGVKRSARLLTAVSNRIQRRIVAAKIDSIYIRKSPWEVELIFNIKMGLQLLNTDTPQKARERNLARRNAKKEVRQPEFHDF